MSGGVTETCPAMTLLACAVAMAWTTAGPVGLRSSQSSYASAIAPASAPASALFCAWLRAVISMPTSMASMLAPSIARAPRPTNTSENPDSSVANLRRRVNRMMIPPYAVVLLDALFLLVGGLRLFQAGGRFSQRLLVLLQVFLALPLGLGVLLRHLRLALRAFGVELFLARAFDRGLLVRDDLLFSRFLLGHLLCLYGLPLLLALAHGRFRVRLRLGRRRGIRSQRPRRRRHRDDRHRRQWRAVL